MGFLRFIILKMKAFSEMVQRLLDFFHLSFERVVTRLIKIKEDDLFITEGEDDVVYQVIGVNGGSVDLQIIRKYPEGWALGGTIENYPAVQVWLYFERTTDDAQEINNAIEREMVGTP